MAVSFLNLALSAYVALNADANSWRLFQPRLVPATDHIIQQDAFGSTAVKVNFINPSILPIRDLEFLISYMDLKTDTGQKVQSDSSAGAVPEPYPHKVPGLGTLSVNLGSGFSTQSRTGGLMILSGNVTDADVCVNFTYRAPFQKREQRFRFRMRQISAGSFEWFPSGACPPSQETPFPSQ